MDSFLFKFFLFAIIVHSCHSSKAAKNTLKDIIKGQQEESDLEKQQQQGPQSYRDKLLTSTSKGSESDAPTSKLAKEATKLNINESTTAVEDSNIAEGTKKELNKGKGKVADNKNTNIEEQLDGKSGISVQLKSDGNYQYDLIQPLDMQSDNRFNKLLISEENLPDVQIKSTNLEGTHSTGNDGQIRRNNKGKGKDKKKKQQPKNVKESRVDLVESGSGQQNENDPFDYNSFEETPIIVTDIKFRQFKAAFESFLVAQETYLDKELKKLNDGEILHQLVFVMTEQKHDGKWHKSLGKVLVKIAQRTHGFWRENVAQILSKEPSVIIEFYKTMTAIYLGPKEGRSSVEAKKIIFRVNQLAMLVFKGFWIHKQKSAILFMDAVEEFNKKIVKFQSEFVQINNKPNLKDPTKKERMIKDALVSVTNFYRANFVEEDKFNEYFHVAVLMINRMPKDGDGAKLYSCWMRLANAESAKWIDQSMIALFNKIECGDFKAYAMKVFNDYFEKAQTFPSELDIHEINKARTGLLASYRIEERTNTKT